MYHLRWKTLLAAAIIALAAGALAVSPLAAMQSHTMSGSITDISSRYETVVVEVPMGDEMFTVAGPIHEKTELKRNGRSVTLEQFQSGDRVNVRWHTEESGHVIDGLVYPAGR